MDDNKSDNKHEKTRTYYVNGEAQSTDENKLLVRTILETAGFKPYSDYTLIRNDGKKTLNNYDDEEEIHNNEKYTAVYKGQTPVSRK